MTLKHGQKSEKKKEIDVENQTGIKNSVYVFWFVKKFRVKFSVKLMI